MTQQNSPKVPFEPRPLTIPHFHTKPSLFRYVTPVSSQPQCSLFELNQPLIQFQPFTVSATTIGHICTCLNVLIADDDLFQHFYYENLFQRFIEPHKSLHEKKDVKVKMFTSGEDLIEKFRSLKKCQCEKLSLIILDYSMGRDKLDGVNTALALRKLGFKGYIVLRTSETQKAVFEKHSRLGNIIMEGIIDAFVDKSDHAQAKKAIQDLLRK